MGKVLRKEFENGNSEMITVIAIVTLEEIKRKKLRENVKHMMMNN